MLSARDRFWLSVSKTEDCWLWTGYLNHAGYGAFFDHGRTLAHRYAWEMDHGPVPNGMAVDHICFVRACVNPAHLRLLTISENCSRKLRSLSAYCQRGHEWTPENTYITPAKGTRVCKVCRRGRQAKYDAQRRLLDVEAAA